MRRQQPNTLDRRRRSGAPAATVVHPPQLIGVGVDGATGGRDAVVLGVMLARALHSELMLIAVYEQPLLEGVLPAEVGWTSFKEQARAMLADTRDALAPEARITVQSNALAWRGLLHVARAAHRDLLVVGSPRHGNDGQVGLGSVADELLPHLECPLAIAPRGMRDRADAQFSRIGVGFDATPESEAALALGGAIARAAGADLFVRGLVDDRVADVALAGDAIAAKQLASLSGRAQAAARATGARVHVDVVPGVAAESLRVLSDHVDLLVIGSGHSGAPGRAQLGSTGETLVNEAATPVLVAPRPRHATAV